ncbi:MAG: cysteine hydrolase [Propionibacteriaceae bacterium]|jgi:nicotinamidase-related amidase|nr:cysteine hydrolase [Propionibacteriaceae bacterium]
MDFTSPHFDRSALVMIDVQADFMDGGTLQIDGTSAKLPQMVELTAAFRAAKRPIVHIIRFYLGDDVDLVRRAAVLSGASMVLPGTTGAQVPTELLGGPVVMDDELLLSGKPQEIGPDEVIIYKPRWSAFYRTPLHEWLQLHQVDTVVVAGCNFPNCPRSTMFDASEHDYRVVVATDAISQITPDRLSDAQLIGVQPYTIAEIAAAL